MEDKRIFRCLFLSHDIVHWSVAGRLQPRSVDLCGCCSVAVAIWSQWWPLTVPGGLCASPLWAGFIPTSSFTSSSAVHCFVHLANLSALASAFWAYVPGQPLPGENPVLLCLPCEWNLAVLTWRWRNQGWVISPCMFTNRRMTEKNCVDNELSFLPWKWIRSPFGLTYLEGPEWKDTSFLYSEARKDLFSLLTECLLAFANQSRNCLMDLALSPSVLREGGARQGERESQTHYV